MCIEVEGCVDVGVVADKFGKYFSGIYSCKNPVCAEVLKQEFYHYEKITVVFPYAMICHSTLNWLAKS